MRTYKDVREAINGFMGTSLEYIFPFEFTVYVETTVDSNLVTIPYTVTKAVKSSVNGRPRLWSNGKMIELSHCSLPQLCNEFISRDTYFRDIKLAAEKEELVDKIAPHLGRNLKDEVESIGVTIENTQLSEEAIVVIQTGNKELIKDKSLSELRCYLAQISIVESLYKLSELTRRDFKLLTPAEKADLYRFKAIKNSYQDRLHRLLRDIWCASDTYNTDCPVLSGYYLEKDAIELSEWLIINGYKTVYITGQSTLVLTNLYNLINLGWSVSQTTLLDSKCRHTSGRKEEALVLSHG